MSRPINTWTIQAVADAADEVREQIRASLEGKPLPAVIHEATAAAVVARKDPEEQIYSFWFTVAAFHQDIGQERLWKKQAKALYENALSLLEEQKIPEVGGELSYLYAELEEAFGEWLADTGNRWRAVTALWRANRSREIRFDSTPSMQSRLYRWFGVRAASQDISPADQLKQLRLSGNIEGAQKLAKKTGC